MAEYKVKNKIDPAQFSDFRLLGSVGNQIDAYINTRVVSDFGKNEVFAEAEHQFELQDDDATAVGWWRGEFWGKLAISAARVYRYTKDKELGEFIAESARRIMSYQRDDGYIGTYKDADNILAADPEKTRPIMGWACNWNWNVWCRKYTLWGLVEIYMATGEKDILESAVKLADHLIKQLERLGLHLCDVGTFNGLPAGSIIKPMLLLYGVTDDKKYLDFCVAEAEYWDRDDGKIPNIISNALEYKPVHEWYMNPQNWAKAYEFMSCLDGLCELYRYTGDSRYFTAVKNSHELLRKYDYNVLFSVGFNDQFTGAARFENSLTEPCDVIHWIRLCYELYTLTGESKYMDDIERAFLNPLLAAAFEDCKRSARAVRTSGRHMYNPQCGLKYNHCCTNNMPRGLLNSAQSYVMFSDDSLYVNMYTEYTGILNTPFGKVKADISGTYLKNGDVRIKLDCENKTRVMLRIPPWSRKTTVKYAGREVFPSSGSYCGIKLNPGENIINIKFDFVPEIHDFDGDVINFDDRDFRVVRYGESKILDREHMVWNRRSTLHYGPLLMTRSKKCGNTAAEMFGSEKTVCAKNYRVTFTEENMLYNTRVKFIAHFENDTDSFDTYVCDYATGTNRASEDDMELFSVWF